MISWRRVCCSIAVLAGPGLLCSGCYLAPDDSTRQVSIPDTEITAYRLNNEGLRYAAGGRFTDAEFKFQKALFLQPAAVKIYFNLGTTLFMQNRFEEAEKIFAELFRKDPLNQTYRLWLAKTKAEQLQKPGSVEEAIRLLKEGIAEAEHPPSSSSSSSSSSLPSQSVLPAAPSAQPISPPDYLSATILARSLSNIYVSQGEIESALCASSEAYLFSQSVEEGLKHVRLLLFLGYAASADLFMKTALPSGGGGTLNYHLRKIEAAVLLGNLDDAKQRLQAALRLNAADAGQQFDRKLLTIIVGRLLIERGDKVDLSLLDDDEEVEEILNDERALNGPLGGLLALTS